MLKGLFGGTMPMLERGLDMAALRHKLISSNIANEETPGYRAKDINFQQELAGMLGSTLEMSTTSAMHVGSASDRRALPAVTEETAGAALDGNTVSLEKEMVKMAENSINYDTTLMMLTKKFQGLRSAIKEGR
jgi:flagellar basal-body rod protein FlgB